MAFTNITRRINAIIKFDPISESVDIINKNQYYINALLRIQLQQGKDANNENITIFGKDYYADATIFDKEHGNYPALGKFTEWITNYKTGAFYDSLQTTASGTSFKTFSGVPYFNDILTRSGEVAMKLNKKHLKEFGNEILFPELRRRFKRLEHGV